MSLHTQKITSKCITDPSKSWDDQASRNSLEKYLHTLRVHKNFLEITFKDPNIKETLINSTLAEIRDFGSQL
jgi:hypothetical protein